MAFPFLIIGIVFSVGAALAAFILCIICLATGKKKNALMLGIAFIMVFIVVILFAIELFERGKDKLKHGIEWLTDIEEKTHNNTSWNTNNNIHNMPYAYIPPEVMDSVSSGFFDEHDNENYNVPLVYPYRFVSEGGLSDFSSLEKFNSNKKDTALDELCCISFFAFDEKYLLAKRYNMEFASANKTEEKNNLPDFSYILFDFSTGKHEVFMNESRLLEEAEKRGYKGESYLNSDYTHFSNYATLKPEKIQ